MKNIIKKHFIEIQKILQKSDELINKTLKILSGQESFRIKSLVNANCWIKLNQKKSIIKKGSRVDYYDY